MHPVAEDRARLLSPLPPGGTRERLTLYASVNDLYRLESSIRYLVRRIEAQEVIELQFGSFRIFHRLQANSSCLTLQTEGDTYSSLLVLTTVDTEGLSFGAVLESEDLKSGSRWLYGEVKGMPKLLRRYRIERTPSGRDAKRQLSRFQRDARELREQVRLASPK